MSIGIDLVELEEFSKKIKTGGQSFVNKHFLKEEYKGSTAHLAGIYAAKEAVFKTGLLKKLDFLSLQIINDQEGKPKVYDLNGLEIAEVSISISHTKNLVVAIALLNQ